MVDGAAGADADRAADGVVVLPDAVHRAAGFSAVCISVGGGVSAYQQPPTLWAQPVGVCIAVGGAVGIAASRVTVEEP